MKNLVFIFKSNILTGCVIGMVAAICRPLTITGTVAAGAAPEEIAELPGVGTTATAPGATVGICEERGNLWE